MSDESKANDPAERAVARTDEADEGPEVEGHRFTGPAQSEAERAAALADEGEGSESDRSAAGRTSGI